MARTVIFLRVADGSSWTVPSDWNSADNKIHCIGAGGAVPDDSVVDNGPYEGAGGGAYSSITNLSLTAGASVNFAVGAAGNRSAAIDGGDTWFNGSTLAGSSVGAKGGAGNDVATHTGAGGLASAGIGTTKFSGGNGSVSSSGGGGGAAGPDGAGVNGGPSLGGAGNAGVTGGGATAAVQQPGNPGNYWTQSSDSATAGPGGGGGGASVNGTAGGSYGGGAGAGNEFGTGANGGPGLIVIEYTPTVTIVSGHGTITGAATVAAAGARIVTGIAASAGTGAVAGHSALIRCGTFTAAGVAAFAGAAASIHTAAAAITGSAALSGAGASIKGGVTTIHGVAALAGAASSIASGIGSAAGFAVMIGAAGHTFVTASERVVYVLGTPRVARVPAQSRTVRAS